MAESDFGNPEAFFARHGGVPKNPALIRQTLTVLRDPSCSAADLVQVLEKEPAISSKVLKAANSVFFGTPKSITSLKAAIVRLGNHNISRIALSASLGATGGSHWNDFWRHSISVAMLARHIGQFTGAYTKQEEEELFSMGLLHDLGVMIEMDSGEFQRVGLTLKTGPVTLSEAENLVFGFDHGRIGRLVAERWNFPADLVDAIACHHQPEASKDFYRKVIVIHLADLVSHAFQITNVPGESAPPTQEAYLEEFNLPVEQLVIFGEWLLSQKEEIDAFGDLMGS
ncbi:MAG: metal dependent phosphohydrolase [Fibrobacteres bacterium]|nr:metal dependent phosphohydrolase [Fibrobacterota bacterium]